MIKKYFNTIGPEQHWGGTRSGRIWRRVGDRNARGTAILEFDTKSKGSK